jgi:tRNA-specific 2-thiouridylase
MTTRAVIAMSGGVDSSVAAALLVEQGHEVIGVMMRLWAEEENRCCNPSAVGDAQAVADRLGIPFHLVNFEAEFKASVVDSFVAEYVHGRTPNPCLACNREIRFRRLLGFAESLGGRWLATGHYARVDRSGTKQRLCVGIDPAKDQSYVLYMLDQETLRRVRFPIGAYTKEEVRSMARQLDLDVADKDESMEICFIADDDYRRFLRKRVPDAIRPGPILDTAGREIGRHEGLPFHTVGQRRGLGIAASEALYVIRLEVERNALVVGPARELGRRSLEAEDVSYVSGEPPAGPTRVQAKIRYRATMAEAWWMPRPGNRAKVDFDVPLRDITPGQAVVAYRRDFVLGGGIISR